MSIVARRWRTTDAPLRISSTEKMESAVARLGRVADGGQPSAQDDRRPLNRIIEDRSTSKDAKAGAAAAASIARGVQQNRDINKANAEFWKARS